MRLEAKSPLTIRAGATIASGMASDIVNQDTPGVLLDPVQDHEPYAKVLILGTTRLVPRHYIKLRREFYGPWPLPSFMDSLEDFLISKLTGRSDVTAST